jgi:hypothetical protein
MNITGDELWNWFISSLDKKENGCWEWSGCRINGKYGLMVYNGGVILTHRYALAHNLKKDITKDTYVLHSCNNPPCCNPDHLREGSHQENMTQRNTEGRLARGKQHGDKVRGEKQGQSKLTDSQVIEIRENTEKLSQNGLANKYRVSRWNIRRIQQGLSWTHVSCLAQLELKDVK